MPSTERYVVQLPTGSCRRSAGHWTAKGVDPLQVLLTERDVAQLASLFLQEPVSHQTNAASGEGWKCEYGKNREPRWHRIATQASPMRIPSGVEATTTTRVTSVTLG